MRLLDAETDYFFQQLDSQQPPERETAIAVLWHSCHSDPVVIKKVCSLVVDDPSVSVRREAAKFLAGTRNTAVVSALTQAIKDADWGVRGFALLGLKGVDPKIFEQDSVKQTIERETHPFVLHCLESVQ